jgi:hypothetical protein
VRSGGSLEETLRQHDSLTLFPDAIGEGEEDKQCIFGKQFEAYLQTACQDVLTNPSHISINEFYLEMFKKYMEWRTVVPKNHRNRIGERGHRCIWHAMEDYYQKVRLVELSLPSPKLYLPPELPEPPLLPGMYKQNAK